MKTLFGIGLLAACLFGAMPPVLADSPQEAATEFVQRRHLGSNLKTLGLAVATHTQTYAMLVSKLGVVQALGLVSSELGAQVYRYEPEWNANLAQAYAHHAAPECPDPDGLCHRRDGQSVFQSVRQMTRRLS
jgi:hypothetical protein